MSRHFDGGACNKQLHTGCSRGLGVMVPRPWSLGPPQPGLPLGRCSTVLPRSVAFRCVGRPSGAVHAPASQLQGWEAAPQADLEECTAWLGPEPYCCLHVHHGFAIAPCCRWEGGNGPRPTDWVATSNLIEATPKDIKRFVMVSSVGVERYNQFPFIILNLFGEHQHQQPVPATGMEGMEGCGGVIVHLRPCCWAIQDGVDVQWQGKGVCAGQRLVHIHEVAGEGRGECVQAVAVRCLSLIGATHMIGAHLLATCSTHAPPCLAATHLLCCAAPCRRAAVQA